MADRDDNNYRPELEQLEDRNAPYSLFGLGADLSPVPGFPDAPKDEMEQSRQRNAAELAAGYVASQGRGTVEHVLSQEPGETSAVSPQATDVFFAQEYGRNGEDVNETNEQAEVTITSVTNRNPDPDGSFVPVGINPVGGFRISVGSNVPGEGQLHINSLTFRVGAKNVDLAHPKLYAYENPSDANKIEGQLQADGTVVFQNLSDSVMNTQIAAGDHGDFALELDVQNPQVNPDESSQLQISLKEIGGTSSDGSVVTQGNLGVPSTAYRS